VRRRCLDSFGWVLLYQPGLASNAMNSSISGDVAASPLADDAPADPVCVAAKMPDAGIVDTMIAASRIVAACNTVSLIVFSLNIRSPP
jgi:hypothetical protein